LATKPEQSISPNLYLVDILTSFCCLHSLAFRLSPDVTSCLIISCWWQVVAWSYTGWVLSAGIISRLWLGCFGIQLKSLECLRSWGVFPPTCWVYITN